VTHLDVVGLAMLAAVVAPAIAGLPAERRWGPAIGRFAVAVLAFAVVLASGFGVVGLAELIGLVSERL
jgi:hypothetical protein